MLLINLIVAILLERFFPSPFVSVIESMSSLLALVREKMDVGEKIPSIISWIGVMVIVALLVWLIWFLLGFIHPIFSIIFSIIILYLSLGFSNFMDDSLEEQQEKKSLRNLKVEVQKKVLLQKTRKEIQL